MSKKYSVGIDITALDRATVPIRKVVGALEQFKKAEAIQRMGRALGNVRSAFQGVTHEAGLFATRMAGLTAAGAGLFAAFIQPAAAMEQLRFRLKRLYGDGEKAGKMFKFIQDFAIQSPYGIQAITEGLLKLKGQGFDNLEQFKNIMNYLAVYVPDEFRANNALIQMSQAWGKAKLQMSDIRPMIEAGIPVWSLLEKVTGKNTAALMKMSESGTLSRDIMLKMFTLMGKEATGAGSEIFDLWSTKLSNLGDVWTKFADGVMNTKLGDLSVFGELKADMDKLQQFLNEGMSGEKGKQVAQTLSEIYGVGKELVTTLVPLTREILSAGKAFSQMAGGMGNAIKLIMALMAVPLVASIISLVASIGGAIMTFAAWVTSAELAWAVLGAGLAILEFLTAPITLVIAGVAALAAAAYLIVQNWEAISGWFVAMWQEWGGAIRLVFPFIGVLVDLAEVIMANWGPITDFFKGVMDGISNAFKVAADIALQVWKPVQDFFVGLGNMIGQVVSKIPNNNAFTGQKSFSASGPQSPGLSMAPSVTMSGANKLTAVVQPKKDMLDVALKVDFVGGTAQVASAKSRGDSSMNYKFDMGLTSA